MKKNFVKRILAFLVVSSFLVGAYASAQKFQVPQNPGNTAPMQGQQGPPPNQEIVAATAVYTQSGGTVSKTNQTIAASNKNQSGIKVADGGTLILQDSTVTTTGVTSSDDNSNFYGLNAAVLAESGSNIKIENSKISTSGNGANAIFATGAGSAIIVSNTKIKTTADSSRGLDATLTGTVTATNVDISTEGTHSAAIATDRGNGTVIVTGGTMWTSGIDSPGIYSTGDITVTDAKITANGSEAAVVEGKNSISLKNTTLAGAKKRGVMMYQSFSGDAEEGTSHFTMDGGALTAEVGPLFYVTNTDAAIHVKGVNLTVKSGTLLMVGAGNWGTTGANGATVVFKADGQTLNGNIICDNISTIKVQLQNQSAFEGTINKDNSAKSIALILEKSSTWSVTGTSYLTSLTDDDSTLSNIDDNGFTIYYDAGISTNDWLANKTYTLKDGGKLVPKE
jgi:hypothetical protein